MKIKEIEVSYQESVHGLPDNIKREFKPVVLYKDKDIRFVQRDNLLIYSIFEKDILASYLVMYWNNIFNLWGAKQSWTDPNFRRQGLSTILFEYLILEEKKKPMISDFQMSYNAVMRMEKMIGSGKIHFSILDTDNKAIIPANPNIPIYDVPIQGHPNVSDSNTRFRYVWLMEEDQMSKLGVPITNLSNIEKIKLVEHIRDLK